MTSTANTISLSLPTTHNPSSLSKPKSLPDFYLRFRNQNPKLTRVGISVTNPNNRIRTLSTIRASTASVMEASSKEKALPTIVEVDLGNRSYPIYIGSGLLDQPELLQRHVHGKRVLVVTNSTVAPLYLDKVVDALTRGNPNVSVDSVILPDGEKYKNMVSVILKKFK
jgi:3-dehydroquinate synthase